MLRAFALTAALLVTGTVSADVKYLVPISLVQPVPGAYNSEWVSVFTVLNRSEIPLQLPLYQDCQALCTVIIPPHGSLTAPPAISANGGKVGPGDFLIVSEFASKNLSMSLRIQDVSRQALTFGTAISVVPETEALTGNARFLDVPTDDRFRQMLRVYDFDGRLDATVLVRVYSPDGTLLGEATLPLQTTGIPEQRLVRPGYAEIGWLAAAFPQIASYHRVRFELVPATSGLRYWGFISVTNNETQHVTVIEPATE